MPGIVIHTYSRQETKVERHLQNQGLEVFLPRITARSHRQDRVRLLEVPLFPGYLFVHADLSTPVYYDILKNTGVIAFWDLSDSAPRYRRRRYTHSKGW
ncbi:MAG: transcription termination/antitermination NusG family protein [Desulfobaccales bacterium]